MDVAQEDIVYPKPIGFDTTSSTSVIACFSSEPFITACVFSCLLGGRKVSGQFFRKHPDMKVGTIISSMTPNILQAPTHGSAQLRAPNGS